MKVFSNGILGAYEAGYEADLKTIELTIKAKADFSEFGMLCPYKGSAIYEKYIREGVIKKDSEFHLSYAFDTPIKHSEKHKNKLRTLSLLGTVGTVWPWLWPTLRRFLKVRPNILMIILYHMAKSYSLLYEIYPFERGFWDKAKIFLWGLRTEIRRRKLG